MQQLNLSLVRHDLKRNVAVNLTLFFFLFLSALLLATGVVVIERLSGSLDQMEAEAKTPHLLQMLDGKIEEEELTDFLKEADLVQAMEIQDLAKVNGMAIAYQKANGEEGTLAESLLDHYFVRQNERMDFLLDKENQVLHLKPGQLGFPVSLARTYGLKEGDQVQVKFKDYDENFEIASLVRDGQMGSSMASSLRFLLSPEDFGDLYAASQDRESIIAFRLEDEGDLSHFQSLYTSQEAPTPKGGIIITAPLIRLLNGLGDGLMSLILILVSLVLMVVAMINIRYSLLSTLEEEVQEIGALKAIGLQDKDIHQIYMSKYRFLALLATVFGIILSWPLSQVFLQNMSLNFGLSQETIWTFLLPLLAGGLLYLVVTLNLRLILRRISQLTILDALKGKPISQLSRPKKKKNLPKLKVFGNKVDWSYSLHDYRIQWRSWRVFILVFFLSALTIALPLSLWTTLKSPDFIQYMGMPPVDLIVNLPEKQGPGQIQAELEKDFLESGDLEDFQALTSYLGLIEGEEGQESLKVEAGDYHDFSLEMVQGRLPHKEDELALSLLNAERLDLDLGDDLTIDWGVDSRTYRLVGSYQDISWGGQTAKIADRPDGRVYGHSYYVKLAKDTNPDAFAEAWAESYPMAQFIPVQKMVDQSLGTVTASLFVAVLAVFLLVLIVSGLITVLFLTLQLYRNQRADATLSGLGFGPTSLRKLYLYQVVLSMSLGLGLGVLFALSIGQALLSQIILVLQPGISHFSFSLDPLYFLGMVCLSPFLLGVSLSWLVTSRLKNQHQLAAGQV